MTPSEALKAIERDAERIVSQEALGLHARLVQASPVDKGAFKASWSIDRKSPLRWTIVNTVNYASILWAGRRTVGGKAYGSEQWVHGGDPMLKQTDIAINRRMKGIKR